MRYVCSPSLYPISLTASDTERHFGDQYIGIHTELHSQFLFCNEKTDCQCTTLANSSPASYPDLKPNDLGMRLTAHQSHTQIPNQTTLVMRVTAHSVVHNLSSGLHRARLLPISPQLLQLPQILLHVSQVQF